MRAAPTLDGRVRIDPESDLDLMVLRSVLLDAKSGADGFAGRLVEGMDESLAEDWEEFVLPELAETFDGQLRTVSAALEDAAPGEPVYVGKEDAEAWYGALNQARLALEAGHRCSEYRGLEELEDADGELRSACIRSNFYMALQSLLLEFVMGD